MYCAQEMDNLAVQWSTGSLDSIGDSKLIFSHGAGGILWDNCDSFQGNPMEGSGLDIVW